MADLYNLYDSHYGQLGSDPQVEVRQETYGEDLGQSSWITLDELRGWLKMLRLDATQKLLEVACGSGGVTCWLARESGAACVGVDINVNGIEAARRRVGRDSLSYRVSFAVVDGGRRLPYEDATFDAVFCNDAINHIPNRPAVFREWHRVLRAGGRVLFTDPILVTGLLTNEEIRTRSSIGYYLFTPPGCNERLLQQTGFALVEVRDVTEAVATVSGKWHAAREKRRHQLTALEGEETFAGLQRFLWGVHTLASERRLSRYAYLASK